jgi:hypothetical protein
MRSCVRSIEIQNYSSQILKYQHTKNCILEIIGQQRLAVIKIEGTMKMFRVLCLALLLLLTSCGVLQPMPPNQAVKLAITRQLTDTQQAIAQELGIPSSTQLNPKDGPIDKSGFKPNFKIDQLTIQSREKLNKQPVPQGQITGDVYRVRGTFSATLAAPGHPVKQSSPFDIYLSTDPQDDSSEVKTWFLIKQPPDQANLAK